MSNIWQVKRGEGIPHGKLAPYELGYSTSEHQLFIGGEAEDGKYGQALPLGGRVDSPVTTIIKSKDNSKENQKIKIYCENLVPGKDYKLYLYTFQKHRGKASRYWHHPSDYILYNENNEMITGSFIGYANIANQPINGSEVINFPPIPDWMKRLDQKEDQDDYKGVLQTEWTFEPEKNYYVLEIDLNSWIKPLLKAHENDGNWNLMGIPYNKPEKYSRLFQFRVVDDSGKIGNANNFMAISSVEGTPEGEVSIGYVAIRQ